MEDPKVPFADTTARRAQLMAATERFKTTITDEVSGIKDDAAEVGKTAAFVVGAALAVYLVVNAILPKSDEYRYAEKYGEPDEEEDYEDDNDDAEDDDQESTVPSKYRAVMQKANKKPTSLAASGLIGGLVTSIVTNLAREQLSGFLARIRSNNAINPTADPTEYHEKAPTEPVSYTS